MAWRLISLKCLTMNWVNQELRLWDEALQLAQRMGVAAVHVTLSDERHYACATVIIES